MAIEFETLAPRPAPVRTVGAWPWMKRNLFGDAFSAVVTVLIVALAIAWLPGALDWAIFRAVWAPDLERCNAARGVGAWW